MNIFPFRVHFAKQERLRFLSHHDVMRTLERALRRSELPLRMTEGHHPHPRLSLPTALGIGIESGDEVLEIELTSWVAPRQVQKQLAEQLPQGLSITEVVAFARRDRSRVDYVEYEAAVPDLPPDIGRKIAEVIERREVVVGRRRATYTKSVEVRQYLLNLSCSEGGIVMRIKVTDGGTAKPEEVLEALGIPMTGAIRIRKIYTEIGKRGNAPARRWKT